MPSFCICRKSVRVAKTAAPFPNLQWWQQRYRPYQLGSRGLGEQRQKSQGGCFGSLHSLFRLLRNFEVQMESWNFYVFMLPKEDWWIWEASGAAPRLVSRGRGFFLWASFSSDRLRVGTGEHKFIHVHIYPICYACHVSRNVDRGAILHSYYTSVAVHVNSLELRILLTKFKAPEVAFATIQKVANRDEQTA